MCGGCVRLHLLQEAPSRLPPHHNRGIARKEESSNPCRPLYSEMVEIERRGESSVQVGIKYRLCGKEQTYNTE